MKPLFEALFGPLFEPMFPRGSVVRGNAMASDRTIAALDALALWERQCDARRTIHQLSEPFRLRWRAHRRWREEGRWLELERERVCAVLLSDDWDAPGKIAEARKRPDPLPIAKELRR